MVKSTFGFPVSSEIYTYMCMFHETKSKVFLYVLLMTDFNSAFKAKSFCVMLIVMCSVAGSDVAVSWHSPCGCLPCGIPGEIVCVSIYPKAFSGYVRGGGGEYQET